MIQDESLGVSGSAPDEEPDHLAKGRMTIWEHLAEFRKTLKGKDVVILQPTSKAPQPGEQPGAPAPPNAALTLPPRSTLSPLQKLLAGLKLDINQATVAELRALPDLGDGLAQAIAAARRAKPLGCEAELLRISGLGASRLRRVLPYLKPLPRRCSSAPPPPAWR